MPAVLQENEVEVFENTSKWHSYSIKRVGVVIAVDSDHWALDSITEVKQFSGTPQDLSLSPYRLVDVELVFQNFVVMREEIV